MYPSTSAYYLIGYFTTKKCKESKEWLINNELSFNQTVSALVNANSCSSSLEKSECLKLNGLCEAQRDAYYAVCVLFILVGLVWLGLFYRLFKKLGNRPGEDWKPK